MNTPRSDAYDALLHCVASLHIILNAGASAEGCAALLSSVSISVYLSVHSSTQQQPRRTSIAHSKQLRLEESLPSGKSYLTVLLNFHGLCVNT